MHMYVWALRSRLVHSLIFFIDFKDQNLDDVDQKVQPQLLSMHARPCHAGYIKYLPKPYVSRTSANKVEPALVRAEKITPPPLLGKRRKASANQQNWFLVCF